MDDTYVSFSSDAKVTSPFIEIMKGVLRMTEYEQVFAKSVCNKLRRKIIGSIYCGIKDDVLRIHITRELGDLKDIRFSIYINDFAVRMSNGLTTDYIVYETLRKYRAYVNTEIMKLYFKEAWC